MKIGITFSILAFVALIVSICIKERKKSLVVQSLNCLLEAVYDFIILAYTGAILSIINFIRTFLFINKEKFIENLLNKCKECFEDCSTEIDITSLQNKIESLKKEKKKLIKLYTTELIDEKEFEEENNIYNEKISAYEEEKINL